MIGLLASRGASQQAMLALLRRPSAEGTLRTEHSSTLTIFAQISRTVALPACARHDGICMSWRRYPVSCESYGVEFSRLPTLNQSSKGRIHKGQRSFVTSRRDILLQHRSSYVSYGATAEVCADLAGRRRPGAASSLRFHLPISPRAGDERWLRETGWHSSVLIRLRSCGPIIARILPHLGLPEPIDPVGVGISEMAALAQ